VTSKSHPKSALASAFKTLVEEQPPRSKSEVTKSRRKAENSVW